MQSGGTSSSQAAAGFGSAISRRDALRHLSLGSLLALGLWPGALKAGNSSGEGSFSFVVLNDLHYMTPECGKWLGRIVQQIRTHPNVEFCLLAGDLTEYGRKQEIGAVKEIFAGLSCPHYVVIGNHDYLTDKDRSSGPQGAIMRAPMHSPSADRAMRRSQGNLGYRAVYPGRLNYSFEHRGWQFIGLDTTQGLAYENTVVQPGTLRWLDRHLPRLDRHKPTVVFTHFPLGTGVKYRPTNADEVLERFKPFNLQAIYCGHWHGFTERYHGSTVVTTNRCCALKRSNHDGSKEKGYFVCSASDGRVSRRFVEVR